MRSSVGRAAVSKTACRRFKSCRACVEDKREYSFPAILAAFLLTVALMMGVVSALMENPWSMALAGIVGLAGIGWAMLSWRDAE